MVVGRRAETRRETGIEQVAETTLEVVTAVVVREVSGTVVTVVVVREVFGVTVASTVTTAVWVLVVTVVVTGMAAGNATVLIVSARSSVPPDLP